MKQRFSILVAALALMNLSAFAQVDTTLGKVSGHVQDISGVAVTDGTISFYRNGAPNDAAYKAKTDANGDYTAERIEPGTYMLVLRRSDTPPDKQLDSIDSLKIVGGPQRANFDMTRPQYIKSLSPEQQKQLQEILTKNKTAMAENALIKNLNGDLASSRASIKAKDFASAETLMLKDTALIASSSLRKDQAALLWVELGTAQNGLKKYDDAAESLQKALALNDSSVKPNPEVTGVANNALGEALVKLGKYDDAKIAYDTGAKAFPAQAFLYYENEAISFFQTKGMAPAQQAEAADKAIAADPTKALPYYLKGNGLAANTTYDEKTKKFVLPPGCEDAYQMYLQLEPTGQFAQEVKDFLTQAGSTVKNSYRAGKK